MESWPQNTEFRNIPENFDMLVYTCSFLFSGYDDKQENYTSFQMSSAAM